MRTPKTFSILALWALLLTSLLSAGCGEDNENNPAGPTGPAPKTILLLGDGGTETHVFSTLKAAGFEVRHGGLFYEFDGSGLNDVDAVVLLAGVDYNNDMNNAGETALVAFVNDGGGLLTTEWLSFSIARQSFHQIIKNVIPVTYAGSYSTRSQTYTVLVDHAITENLPATFVTKAGMQHSALAPRGGSTQVVRGDVSGAAVVTWTKGGRVVSLSMAGEYGQDDVWTPETDQLIVDAVGFISHK